MKNIWKIAIILFVILAFMVYRPSMLGSAQSFVQNIINSKVIDVKAEELEEELGKDQNDKVNDMEEKDDIEYTDAEDRNDYEGDDPVESVKPDEDEAPTVNIPPSSESKKIFLTFDDGPSKLTPDILDILDEHDVKATFFTIGEYVENRPQIVKDTYDRGHMVLPHTYTHDYSIYTSFETYYNDLELAKSSIEEVLDIDIPYIFRFPGGSSNQSSFKYGGEQFMPKLTNDTKSKGYYYIDWNVSSGDATADYNNREKLMKNVVDGSKNKNFVVALFHDTGRNTTMAQSLSKMIEELKDQGYIFRTFRDITDEELNTMVQLKLSNKPIIR